MAKSFVEVLKDFIRALEDFAERYADFIRGGTGDPTKFLRAQRLAAADALRVAQQFAPVKSGALKKHLKIIPRGRTCEVVAVGIKYFNALTQGSKAHIIQPRQRKSLTFDWTRAKTLRFKGGSPKFKQQRSAPSAGVLRQKKTGPNIIFFKRVFRRRTAGNNAFVSKAIREYERKFLKYISMT